MDTKEKEESAKKREGGFLVTGSFTFFKLIQTKFIRAKIKSTLSSQG